MLTRRMFSLPSAATQTRYLANISPKATVCIVGTGWGGARLVKDLDPKLCNIAVLSQRNHMVFTPLLPQTCTGTLEFRSICEPIVRVQPALAIEPNVYFRTMVYDVDFDQKLVKCMTVGVLGAGDKVPVKPFDVKYDFLVLAHGARANTFNIPGVEENAFFLREISEARGIRRRLVQNLMIAMLPTTSPEERKRLLHVVVVGGGPTGVEFAGDFADFLQKDVPKISPGLVNEIKLTLVEANEVLGTFDLNLRNYAFHRLKEMKIGIKKAIVAEVTETAVVLTDGEVIPTGLVVWSTGVGPSSLNKAIKCDKNKQGRLVVDDHLRLMRDNVPLDSVFALGDCAANLTQPLPTLAAVAARQGKFVATVLNKHLESPTAQVSQMPPFVYKSMGSMASLGRHTALVDLKPVTGFDLKGFKAFIVWRSAYFTMLGSVRSRLYVAVNWFGSLIWGRDVTYIAEISEAKLWRSLAQGGISREQARVRAMQEAAKQAKMSVTLGESAESKAHQQQIHQQSQQQLQQEQQAPRPAAAPSTPTAPASSSTPTA